MDGVVAGREAAAAVAAAAADSPPPYAHPSPSMESAQQQQQQPRPYHYGASISHQQPLRASPSAQLAMPTHSLLPPIHHSASLPSQPQYAAAHPHYAAASQQYAPYASGGMPPAPMPSIVASNGMMRFPIPQALDTRNTTAGRHKKEIKRRTKTGCLTCRKRRIKCDEGQPTCKNCHKSKRDCLGYDPIFKPQSGHAPLAAKPDASVPPPESTLSTGVANPYHPPPSFPLLASNLVYQPSLDPTLPGGNHTPPMAHSSAYLQPERKVKNISIDDLFALGDVSPQLQRRDTPITPSEPMQRDMADFYLFHYAPGLDRMLETDWYTKHGLSYLHASPAIQDFVLQCTSHFQSRADDPHSHKQTRSLEARLVWQLANLPRANPSATQDLSARVATLENLLTGNFLDPSNLPHPPRPGTEAQKYNEQLFWHSLGRFVSARDDHSDPNAHNNFKDLTDALAAMRGILGMLENRDVLYSIAICRHVGGRMPEYHPQRPFIATTNDSNDDVNKVKVAHAFVETEEQRGTTQVIQRMCGMALRGWVLQKQQ